MIYGESASHPLGKLTSECIAVAKRYLKVGETLDGIGGFCYRVSIERAEYSAGAGYKTFFAGTDTCIHSKGSVV